MDSEKQWSIILLDIEGTTTSISFVKDVLFPYAAQNVTHFLKEYWLDTDVQDVITELRSQYRSDVANGISNVPEIIEASTESSLEEVQGSIILNVLWQMKHDMKRPGLKSLQGKIWKIGFEKGELLGHVFEDIPSAFKRLVDNHKKICIYSSGSIEAQKLLFKYSVMGDLTKYITDYFDTQVGSKIEAKSYRTISSHLNVDPKDILFVTDVPNEARAARDASMDVLIMIRDGNIPLSTDDMLTFETINNFEKFY